tara:strand:- start:151 stop:375 length:225 start_codon:yes stop_codon:yes gene_type:complete
MSKINENGVIRDMTAEEEAQLVKDNKESLEMKTAYETAKAKKDTDAKEGNNKLIELGLTQDQVTAMTGYTPPSE